MNRSTPLVTAAKAASFAHVPVSFVRREVSPVACAVTTRALLYPLAAVMRTERDCRLRRILERADAAGITRHADVGA